MFEFTNSQPLVSVGIPTYNRPEGLRHTLECITGQTYRNLEIIVSNNCSPNPAVDKVIESFISDSRIKYFKQAENLGPSFNFRFVLEKSSGEYFMWLGDDDWIVPSYISECVSILIDSPEYSLVAGNAQYFVNDDFKYQGNIISLEQECAEDRMISYYSQVSDNGVFYGVMRRKQISQISIKNTMGGDWIMIATIAFLGKVKTIPNIHVNRQVRENDSYEKLAARLGMSKFQGKYPMFSIGITASQHIFGDKNYQSLSFIQKVKLSYRIMSTFLLSHNLPSLIRSFKILVSLHTPKSIYPKVRSAYNFFKLISSRSK
jgi:glycosyltransferase domain-containing protein